MSRTDKTRPYWVKVNEAGRAYHNHANGVCDLLVDPTRMAGGAGRCGLQYGGHDREVNGCPHSCWMCTAVEKQEKAQRTTRAKRALRSWWREYEDDVEDVPLVTDALNEDDPH